jgi:hypothetical protein
MYSRLLSLFTAVALCGAPLHSAMAQAHVAESGAHTLRASVVPSNRLSSEAAREQGITVADDRGVLTVVVLQGEQGQQRSVPAQVSATRIDLSGRMEPIDMREVRTGGGVSYLGTFRVVTSPTARFRVEAVPTGASQPLGVEFEERFHVPR